MKECTKCKVVKPLDDFSVMKKAKDGKQYMCKTCTREQASLRYNGNKEPLKASMREYYKRTANERKQYIREYQKANKGKCNAKNAKRRASRLQATPKWANLKQIEGTYKLAQYLTEEHGRQIHVDHIVPLQNPLVCGLHVEDNLQLLYADENLSKSNKFEVTV
jgi:hypothetical protein